MSKSRHHRRPKSRGGNGKPRNISHVCAKQHEAWHRLFGNMSPHQIATVINQVWLDPDFVFLVKRVGEP